MTTWTWLQCDLIPWAISKKFQLPQINPLLWIRHTFKFILTEVIQRIRQANILSHGKLVCEFNWSAWDSELLNTKEGHIAYKRFVSAIYGIRRMRERSLLNAPTKIDMVEAHVDITLAVISAGTPLWRWWKQARHSEELRVTLLGLWRWRKVAGEAAENRPRV